MPTITIQVPEIIWESHHHNLESVKTEVQESLVIWEYLNGRLSLRECGNLLTIGYRRFLELLWSKGISIDGLNEQELEQQVTSLRTMLDHQ
jgi:predicted HTH domain antitoxin